MGAGGTGKKAKEDDLFLEQKQNNNVSSFSDLLKE